ncbi:MULTISPECIES: acetoacetate decarboxylase family protein [unclassified Bradyrhizobium]|uniref:acetoacetate decarboxylase family protein n=1 Tax=unclassified Bradyrhizobium TaxID=2631580 RepID=UPI0020B1AC7F|nr:MULTISPECIES: acetoacetate decarboxylase family protein [unclassified Bradyrhizobium]MCP3397204.1 acetoacetate decarboxylase family protein [Bradyrhizobium sp. CCGB20]MCP3405709.1 acetoacetate decarboxylase family protein [Bradyrhizobium sp. CCGB01]
MMEIRGIPFDAPLYHGDEEHGSAFLSCQAVQAIFTIASDVGPLLPKQLRPAADPAVGVVGIASYGSSIVGPYLEQYSGIEVRDSGGETGFYIPYIYVTANDAALASGREALGAPKKFAHIALTRESGLIQGTLERPAGKRLLTITAQPDTRLKATARQMYSTHNNFYSLRHLPPITKSGKGAATQLVKWCTDRAFRRDESGEEVLFTGLISLTYDSPSAIDPVHNLVVGQIILGTYEEYDSRLRAIDLLSDV